MRREDAGLTGPLVRNFAIFALLAGIACYLDLWSKRAVFEWRGMPEQQPIWWIWEGIFGIETSLNTGALFGLGQDRVLLFAVFSILALLGIGYWMLGGGAHQDRSLTLILALVTGGILGNLYDRLGLWTPPGAAPGSSIHAVRDWIRFSYHSFVWPNFNLADSYLVCGAALLVWHSLAPRSPAKTPTG